ncbi:hypothetical protein [Anaerocolumna xylanovorans]|uniref:Uncharacterized protein n=1 Tax=Anaerocolumna xylanovorans DSM 12503 TaxID=1121345 RepID=A0A1M7YKM1_9FIRM|nr:hypothetical protein [Anaerocolumna xylanovorans]SHO53126.1 hypothetical protein SAMN02745217_03979 [Anaerocolumna xylanovorans DSM 12503]
MNQTQDYNEFNEILRLLAFLPEIQESIGAYYLKNSKWVSRQSESAYEGEAPNFPLCKRKPYTRLIVVIYKLIEFADGKMVTTKKVKSYQAATNFNLYNNPNHEGFGKDRYDNIENELEKCNGIISENNALELLKKNVIPGDEQWSAVYNLTRRSVMVTFSRDYHHVYKYEL